MTYKLLIVDDEMANLRLLERLFSPEFHCLTASSGVEAIRLLEQHDIAILITDQRMPMMTGLELLKRTAAVRPHMVRILLTGYSDVEALVEALNSGLVYMYISKPWNNEDLKLRVNRACEHYLNNKKRQALADANQRLTQRLGDIKLSVVAALREMLRIRDKHAHSHALRVRHYAMTIAGKIGVSDEQTQELAIAALLLNIGLVDVYRKGASGIQESPLKQRAQEQSESEAKLFHSIPELANVAEIISCNGENYDGTGLPRGLRGEQIPLSGRILRLADEYDQMVLPQATAPMTHEEVMRFLIQRSGKQFDPTVLEILSQLSSEELGTHRDRDGTFQEYGVLAQDTVAAAYPEAVTLLPANHATLGIDKVVSS
ncbi:MAG: response regulator [Pyrinomonadaceae bacterium]|nr:response regulator [Pyrinomonadaceae bacterium]